MSTVVLSAIDVLWPGDVRALAPHLERLGYARYWTTEHHSQAQSGSPAVQIAVAAAATRRMRIGCAGVLLRFASPLKVAEDFRLLELHHPGRIDLGIASGGTRGPARGALLDGREDPSPESYARKVEALDRLIRGEALADGELAGVRAGPCVETAPELWVCGLGHAGASLAARLGAGFAFNEHLRRNDVADGGVDRRDVVERYRATFRPGYGRAEPRVMVACFGLCAERAEDASALWEAYCDRRGRQLQPTFLGTPRQCHADLLAVQAHYGCDELAIESLCDDLPGRLTSYALVAQAFGLPRASGAEPGRAAEPT